MHPGNPKDGDSTASSGSLSRGCSTLVVNKVLPLLEKDFPGWQHETTACCPVPEHLQEKLGILALEFLSLPFAAVTLQ